MIEFIVWYLVIGFCLTAVLGLINGAFGDHHLNKPIYMLSFILVYPLTILFWFIDWIKVWEYK